MKFNGNDGFGGDVAQRFPSPVETLPQVRSSLPKAPSGEEVGEKEGGGKMEKEEVHGYSCHAMGCGRNCRTAHGFARHLRTHGFGVVGRHLGK